VTEISLSISELFYSIQGESTRAGLPCAFIRLSGCNLRCRYCDSQYTWEEPDKKFTGTEILNWLDQYPEVMVELTGGEPLLQESVYPLMDDLLDRGRTVLLETNGSLSIERIPRRVTVILDIKCPDSGMHELMDWKNVLLLQARNKDGCRDEIKFVLASKQDFEWAGKIVEKYKLAELFTVLFSPVQGFLAPAELADLILRRRMPVRLQLQLHKLIWPGQKRGV